MQKGVGVRGELFATASAAAVVRNAPELSTTLSTHSASIARRVVSSLVCAACGGMMSGLPPAAVLIPADAFVTGPAGAGGGGPSGGGSGDAVGISGGIESDELVLDPTLPPAGMITPRGPAFSGSAGAKSVNVCAAMVARKYKYSTKYSGSSREPKP